MEENLSIKHSKEIEPPQRPLQEIPKSSADTPVQARAEDELVRRLTTMRGRDSHRANE